MRYFRLLLLLSPFISLVNMQAATPVDEFLEHLQASDGRASVRIIQDEAVTAKMRGKQATITGEDAGTAGEATVRATKTVPGYRVQVFSSNEQKTAKGQALRIEADFKNNQAGAATYVSFSAPSWKLRVGDCRNYPEATELMNKLKEEFPTRSSYMFVVRDNIKIPL
jgi:hypothetical protein